MDRCRLSCAGTVGTGQKKRTVTLILDLSWYRNQNGNMDKKKRSRMGRPCLPPDDRRSVHVSVRLTEAELGRLKVLAREHGVTVSDLLMRPWREKRS